MIDEVSRRKHKDVSRRLQVLQGEVIEIKILIAQIELRLQIESVPYIEDSDED